MKSRYSVRYEVESLPVHELERRQQAGEQFGVCDGFVMMFFTADEDGKDFETIDLVTQDGRGQEMNPAFLHGKAMGQEELFRAFLFLAQVLQENHDKTLSTIQRQCVTLPRLIARAEVRGEDFVEEARGARRPCEVHNVQYCLACNRRRS